MARTQTHTHGGRGMWPSISAQNRTESVSWKWRRRRLCGMELESWFRVQSRRSNRVLPANPG